MKLTEIYFDFLKKEIIRLELLEGKEFNVLERNLFETYITLVELLNPNNSYEYRKVGKGWFRYSDVVGNIYDVRITYQPVADPYFELKTWWYDENDKPIYQELPSNSSSQDWDKRSNTIAKIYRDEIIPFFEEHLSYCNKLIFKPVDSQRYYFSKRLIEKFTPKDFKVVEKYPTEIIITKNKKEI